MNRARKIVAAVALAFATSCASDSNISPLMDQVGKDQAAPVPLRGQAVVVFMRPTGDSPDVQSTVYDLQKDGDHFVGVVSDGTRVHWVTWAGSHLFMVIGENADFMNAELAEGKVYYARVVPRSGALKSRFSIKPVRRAQIGTPEWTTWDDTSSVLLRCSSRCEEWVDNNVNSVVGKRNKYMAKWTKKTEGKRRRAGLLAEDGYP